MPPASRTDEAAAVPESTGLPDEMVGTPWNSADGARWRTSALAPSSSWMTRSTGPPAITSRPRPEPCGGGSSASHGGSPATHPASSQPAPAPVSTAANLRSTCVVGWDPYGSNGFDPNNFTPLSGSPNPNPYHGANPPPPGVSVALGYQLTLTNGGQTTADIDGFAVVLYDGNGTELGSDKEDVSETFLTPGQALTWTELASQSTDGTESTGEYANVQEGAFTCQLVAWYHPLS